VAWKIKIETDLHQTDFNCQIKLYLIVLSSFIVIYEKSDRILAS
jgi:hypothetical protein